MVAPKKINKGLKKIGKFAEKKILPAAVSVAIPLASTALGAVATTYGGPMAGEMTQKLSQNLMEENIPKKYQSKNKYVNMFGDALNQGIGAMNGDVDPRALMNLQNEFTGQVANDMSKYSQPKYKTLPYQPPPQYQRPVYNPDNPFQDLMQQLQNRGLKGQQSMPSPVIQQMDDPNDDNDALYKNAVINSNKNELRNTIPPYQQMEGNINGLLGSGIHSSKVKNKGKSLTSSEVQRLDNKKMAKYSKLMAHRESQYSNDDYPELSRAPNPSLHQYLNTRKQKTKREGEEDLRAIIKYLKETEGIETPKERKRNRGHNF
jgi:hypothetical protein